jgi:hypothetical protein
LFQTGARDFTYCVISPDGELLKRQTHYYTDTRPKLHADQDGQIRVAGGKRAVSSTDWPKPSDAELAAPTPAPPPPAPDKAGEGKKD